ncbi:MAG: DMT family transporter [Pseudomonadota bacterium]
MSRGALIAILVGAGLMWGSTVPLTKIAVSTGYKQFGLLFWQMAIMAVFLFVFQMVRGRLTTYRWAHLPIILAVCLFGTLISSTITYISYRNLPAGIMAMIIATVPIFTLPLSIAFGVEKFILRRVLGVLFGLAAVLLLIGPPDALPEGARAIWVIFAICAPVCWALEDISIAKLGLSDLGANQVLLAASVLGVIVVAPFTFLSGQYIDPLIPWTQVEWAFLAATLLHMIAYTTFIWFIGVAGPIMASQASYLVTGFGIAFSVIFLGEGYTSYFWVAAALLAFGLFLVSPRKGEGHDTVNA